MVTNNKQTKLTTRQAIFCKLFVSLGNASEAYRQAGYSPKQANVDSSKLLAIPSIQAEIAKHKQELEQSNTVDAAFVINGLRDIAVNGKTESNRVRSYELLGKTLRMFVDVSENTVTHDVAELQQFTVAQLTAMREQAALRAPEQPIEDVEVLPDAKTPTS